MIFIVVKNNNKNIEILLEYAGRSMTVLRMSYVVRDLLFNGYKTSVWNKGNNGPYYFKNVSLNVMDNNEINSYVNYIRSTLYLIPNNITDTQFNEKYNADLDCSFDADNKTLYINIAAHDGENIKDKIQGQLEHELMHAFQNGMSKNGLNVSGLYTKSSEGAYAHKEDNMTNNQYDAARIISVMPYHFSNVEIDANIQKIWSEVVRIGDYRKCPTYRDQYYKAIRYYKKLKNLYDKNINKEVNKAFIDNYIRETLKMSSLHYFKMIDKGIKKFNTKLGKLISYYNDKIMENHSIDNIISETINRYINENVFDEKKNKKSDDLKRHSIKLKGGSRADFDVKKDKTTNPSINNQDAKELSNILDSDYVNLAAVARDVYPDHTDEGAQSELRKKVKRLKSDSGSTYKIKKKEADRIRKSLIKHIGRT